MEIIDSENCKAISYLFYSSIYRKLFQHNDAYDNFKPSM